MNIPLIVFVCTALIFLGVAGWLLRGVFSVIANLMAEHARTYAISYVKGGALIAIATGACFTETFYGLTKQEAAELAWWGWMILAWKPIAAGLATLCAFLDRSAQAATDRRANDRANGTPSPFATSTPVAPPRTPTT